MINNVSTKNLCVSVLNPVVLSSLGQYSKQEKYQSLPDDEKDKIRQLVYILNRFSVSMDAYHEVKLFF